MQAESYLDKVWGRVESTLVAHLGMALGASVVIGWLCGGADVEAGLTEGATCSGFRGGFVVRLWELRLLLLLLLL